MVDKTFFGGCAAVLLCLATGCGNPNIYEIDLTPKTDQIERKLVLWVCAATNEIREPSAEDVARIVPLYPSTFQPDNEKKRGFVGTFQERMPADVGIRGTYTRFASPMGVAYIYVERFRGGDDLAAQVERRQKAAETVAHLVGGWCKQEFGQEPDFGKLREFIDKNLAHDLVTVSLYGSPLGEPSVRQDKGDTNSTELAFQVGQYLLERDYFTMSELPRIMTSLQREDFDCDWLAAVVGRKLGRPTKHPSLAVFANQERLKASWDKYLPTTPEYQKLLADFKMREKKDSDATPDPGEVLLDALLSLVENCFPSLPGRLTLRLHACVQPYATNGKWNEVAHTVLWEADINQEFPTLCFAVWSEADGRYETEHFGCALLENEALAKYSIWHRTLTENEASEWDGFVDDLKPTDELLERLDEFRFSSGVATDGAELLRKAILKKCEEPKAKSGP